MGLKPEFQGYHQKVKLFDGKEVVIRLINHGDKKSLSAFHARVSNESRFLRYHYFKGELTDDDLTNFCDVDCHDSLGLVAEQERDGQKEIIGVGRFFYRNNNRLWPTLGRSAI